MNATAEHDLTRAQIDIEKIRAEITNLIEDTRKKEDEREKMRSQMLTMQDEREKLRAEAAKMWAQSKWYPPFVGAALLGAGVALAKIFM